jgi:hypothetical protein
MSDPCYEEEHANLRDRAYYDCILYYGREPTEDELQEHIEGLEDEYSWRC